VVAANKPAITPLTVHTELFIGGPPTLTSARLPTLVWEVVRTVAAPPSIVVKCGGVVVLRVVVCGVVLVVSCVVWCCSCCVFVCVTCFFLQDTKKPAFSRILNVHTELFTRLLTVHTEPFTGGPAYWQEGGDRAQGRAAGALAGGCLATHSDDPQQQTRRRDCHGIRHFPR